AASADFAGDAEAAVGLLLEEQLIRAERRDPAEPPPVEQAESDYVQPALQKFTDLQELLLLDPIHDLDAAGHPLGGG
ncbi:MAG: hypothetical protein KDI09_16345, partial [Halioglobus sp.]|nr:hypothetical protein [Halioglobus sp.]